MNPQPRQELPSARQKVPILRGMACPEVPSPRLSPTTIRPRRLDVMRARTSFLRSMLDRLLRRHQKPLPATVAAPIAPKQSTTARERVRSGIEPLEGRIAPAILVNAHLLTYTCLLYTSDAADERS